MRRDEGLFLPSRPFISPLTRLGSRIYRRKQELSLSGGAAPSFDALFSPNPWYRRLFPDFRELDPQADQLPPGVHSGCEYTGLCINTAVYLPWLVGQCRRLGVVFRRGRVSDVREAHRWHHQHPAAAAQMIVVNATGLGSKTLGGVEDERMSPIRGQIVLVENEAQPMFNVSGTDDGDDEVAYLMTRAAGGGTVLGGTYQRGSWGAEPDPETEKRIIRRCLALSPALAQGGVDSVKVIRSGVGLRPYREGGVRVEADLESLGDGGKSLLVHNYGHAGWGYQGSYGCAERVVQLIDEFLEKERAGKVAVIAKL